MNETKKYWRDIVLDLLKWGTAVFVLFAGWAASGHYEIFKIKKDTNDHIVAAFGLLIFTVAYSFLLPMAMSYIYRKHLKEGTDETVLPRKFARLSACVLAFLQLIVAVLMVFV